MEQDFGRAVQLIINELLCGTHSVCVCVSVCALLWRRLLQVHDRWVKVKTEEEEFSAPSASLPLSPSPCIKAINAWDDNHEDNSGL